MTDGDDKLTRRYRELPADEPPATLDAAIRAAAHDAVAPRRSTQRWAVPASIAAVLVLATGVTLRMQQEVPGIEVAPPASVSEYSAPPAAAEPPPQAQAAPSVAARDAQAPAVASPPLELAAKKRAAPTTDEVAATPATAPPPPAPAPKLSAPKDAREADAFRELRRDTAAPAPIVVEEKKKAVPEEVVAQKPQQPQLPKAFADSADRNVAAPAAAPLAAPKPLAGPATASAPPAPARSSAVTQPPPEAVRQEAARVREQGPAVGAVQAVPQAKTEGANVTGAPATSSMAQARAKQDASANLAKEAKGPLERELDRIATLRREGRHAEADEALAKFRKDNPNYRIPDTVWEQVKPR